MLSFSSVGQKGGWQWKGSAEKKVDPALQPNSSECSTITSQKEKIGVPEHMFIRCETGSKIGSWDAAWGDVAMRNRLQYTVSRCFKLQHGILQRWQHSQTVMNRMIIQLLHVIPFAWLSTFSVQAKCKLHQKVGCKYEKYKESAVFWSWKSALRKIGAQRKSWKDVKCSVWFPSWGSKLLRLWHESSARCLNCLTLLARHWQVLDVLGNKNPYGFILFCGSDLGATV